MSKEHASSKLLVALTPASSVTEVTQLLALGALDAFKLMAKNSGNRTCSLLEHGYCIHGLFGMVSYVQ